MKLRTIAPMLLAVVAWAQPPDYDDLQLQARANFSGAFNLPDGAFFANVTASLNNAGEAAFNVGVLPGSTQKGVWFGGGGSGGLVYTSPADAFIFSASVNDSARVIFEQTDIAPGLYFYDHPTMMSGPVTNRPIGALGWSSAQVNDSGHIGFRARFATGNAYYVWDGSDARLLVAEVDVDFGSPYSFLFTPSFNDMDQIAGKVRLGASGQFGEERPDQIRIFNLNGTSSLIAEDRDSNPGSPFDGFDNGVSLTDNGWVAFNATADGVRGVYLSNGTELVRIADENDADISTLEVFNPVASNNGLVAFRAFDGAGLRAVWAGDGQGLSRIAGEHDLVPIDLGQARIDQHDGSPVFGGGLAINDNGQVAFSAGLTPPDNNQVEWGSGLFVATPGGGPALNATLVDAVVVDGGGDAMPGDTLLYTATINNPDGSVVNPETNILFQCDLDPLSPLVVGSVMASQGAIATGNNPGDTRVEVEIGALAAGASATVTFQAVIPDPLRPGVAFLRAQGQVEGDLTPPLLTDDPDNPAGIADPTDTQIDLPPDNDFRYYLGFWLLPPDPFTVDGNGNGLIDILDMLALPYFQP